MDSLLTLYVSHKPVSECCTNTVLSPYLMIGAPITSKSLSSKIIF